MHVIVIMGELPLSRIHTVTEYEMSGEPYSQMSRWIILSSERILVSIHSVVLPVMANIAQCFIGDWECITVVDPEWVRSPFPLLNIL